MTGAGGRRYELQGLSSGKLYEAVCLLHEIISDKANVASLCSFSLGNTVSEPSDATQQSVVAKKWQSHKILVIIG